MRIFGASRDVDRPSVWKILETTSLSIMLFNCLRKKCQNQIKNNVPIFAENAIKMVVRLDLYRGFVENSLARLPRFLDTLFSNNFITDGVVLGQNLNHSIVTIRPWSSSADLKSLRDDRMDDGC